MSIKLVVLQRTWNMQNKGSASRARREFLARAGRLAGTPHNQAEAISSLVSRAEPIIRQHGFAGLVALLSEKQ